jgi:hypothetical protein
MATAAFKIMPAFVVEFATCASKVEIVRGLLPSLVGVTVMGNDLTVRRRSPLQIESVRSRSRRACGV